MRPRGAWPPGAADPTVLSTPPGSGPAVRSSGRDPSSVLTHSAPSRYSLFSALPPADQPRTLPSCTRFCPLKTSLVLTTLVLEARHTLCRGPSPRGPPTTLLRWDTLLAGMSPLVPQPKCARPADPRRAAAHTASTGRPHMATKGQYFLAGQREPGAFTPGHPAG